MIYRKDDKADQLVKIYLSFFSISRLIKLAKRVDKSTFESICSPTDTDRAYEFCGEVRPLLRPLFARYCPWPPTIPLNQGMKWDPTWKSLPTYKQVTDLFKTEPGLEEIVGRCLQSPFPALTFEIRAFAFLLKVVHSSEDLWSQGILFPERTRYAWDPANKIFSGTDLDQFERTLGPALMSFDKFLFPAMCGKLGCSIEGGGKQRIFAIGNYVNQRLLKPVHDWLMEVLARIPMDGTFNQGRPPERLVGKQVCYSFDLKSATDRWPYQLLFEVFQSCFDRSFSAGVRSALAYNIFHVPFVRDKKDGTPSYVSFVAGQPLGYYSSWPLFALSHHVLIWWCAEQVRPGQRFTAYAVLGDDVVIADREVGEAYEAALDRLSVKISYQKSLISNTGAAEFAKRFLVNGLTKDLSPISVRSLCNFYHPYGLVAIGQKFPSVRFTTIARVGGAGYKQVSRLDHTRSLHFDRVWAIRLKNLLGKGSLELWLG